MTDALQIIPAPVKETAAAKKRRRTRNSLKRALAARDQEIARLKADLETVCEFIQTHMAGTEALNEVMKAVNWHD